MKVRKGDLDYADACPVRNKFQKIPEDIIIRFREQRNAYVVHINLIVLHYYSVILVKNDVLKLPSFPVEGIIEISSLVFFK
jgi:hypothetical protein